MTTTQRLLAIGDAQDILWQVRFETVQRFPSVHDSVCRAMRTLDAEAQAILQGCIAE